MPGSPPLVQNGRRFWSASLRHARSALSLGPGYETTPPGRFLERDSVRGYFIDFTTKTTSSSARAPDALNPAGLAQLGLGWWERMLAGERRAADEFLVVCEALEKRAVAERGALWWPSKVPVNKYVPLSVFSSLPQAQVISVFIRAFLLTGESRWESLALRALPTLLSSRTSELVRETEFGPVLEESPSEPPSHILNGWIYALFGLWETRIGIGHERAAEMFESSTACLRTMLRFYDVGWWTRYSLYPHRLPDLAKPFYHRLHVHQVEVLYHLFGHSEFGDAAHRWSRYDTPVGRTRAIGQKALFVVSGYR
jgi:heparosan-N-sulfate-glucuronate 5-epimerase